MLKTYMACIDGKNDLMVSASSKKEAAKLFETTVYQIKQYGYIVGIPAYIEIANSTPGKVWTRETTTRGPWQLLGESNVIS